jgi:hypothetical protein
MKFNYRVKHNGIVYPAGADVPVGNIEPKQADNGSKEAEKVENKPVKNKAGNKRTKK